MSTVSSASSSDSGVSTPDTSVASSATASAPPSAPLSPHLKPTAAATPATPAKRSAKILSRAEIAERICAGQLLLLRDEEVLNVTNWAKHHPGGALALQHFVGRDAGDEIVAYHSAGTLERMSKFVVGRVELDDATGWKPLTPPIALGLRPHPDGVKGHWMREGRIRLEAEPECGTTTTSTVNPGPVGLDVVTITPKDIEPPAQPEVDLRTERKRSRAYRTLKARIEQAGLFSPPGPLAGYGEDIARYLILAGASAWLFFNTTGWAGQMASAALLGFVYQQLTFVAHDAGHTGITGDWWWDRVIGMIIADWIGGLSLGWWCDNHDIHHLVTNHPEHDPDIQHIPFFAISSQFFRSLWSTYYKRIMAFDGPSRFLIQVQHKLYYIVLSLARFNLYALSYMYLFSAKAKKNAFWWFEVAGLCFYWTYFGSILRSQASWQTALGYLLVSHVCASPVHVQIVLSHFACSTDDLGPTESFPSRQLRTTMDVVCSEDAEFIHGGLHLQVTHHLFPRLPRHNLRKASLLVKDYCREHDIEYLEYGWLEGNKKVLNTLQDVANQLKILKQVADKEVAEKMQ